MGQIKANDPLGSSNTYIHDHVFELQGRATAEAHFPPATVQAILTLIHHRANKLLRPCHENTHLSVKVLFYLLLFGRLENIQL
jgi:hypothetical protein